MPISYADALAILQAAALELRRTLVDHGEKIPIGRSAGRTVAQTVISPRTTPPFDSSAMDGFAVNSEQTLGASDEAPVMMAVQGTIAAGDAPIALSSAPTNGIVPCVEIMTGAQFPQSSPRATTPSGFDACVPVEQVTEMFNGDHRFIRLTKPARPMQHHRLAGSDYREGDVVAGVGTVIQLGHIMAMASLGIREVVVERPIRLGIISTGSELRAHESDGLDESRIFDSNGPYLAAALEQPGRRVARLDHVHDSPEAIVAAIRESSDCDVIVSTGAVSRGKYDYVCAALGMLRAEIRFHHIAMRPGHPALFARIPSERAPIAFIGLPGNPIATAAGFTFIVQPFLSVLCGEEPPAPTYARVAPSKPPVNGCSGRDLSHLDVFRLGTLHPDGHGWEVSISNDQSPGKVKPFASANCWVHLPQGQGELDDGEIRACYRL